MLILSRRIGESIMIGDNVTVTICGVNGSHVRVGINAPREVAVHREEIYQRTQNEIPFEKEASIQNEIVVQDETRRPTIRFRTKLNR